MCDVDLCYRTVMSMSVDDSGTQRHLLDDSVLDDAVCTSSDSSLPGSGNIPMSGNVYSSTRGVITLGKILSLLTTLS